MQAASSDSKKRAFTLLELLVAIGIVAILAALLIPAVKSTMERSRSAVCVSNLKTIGAGFVLYAADNEQMIPYNLPGGNVTWVQTLAPYVNPSVKPVDSSWSPSESDLGVRPATVWACPQSRAVTKRGSYSDYAKNAFVSETATANASDALRSRGRTPLLKNAAKLIAIGDSALTAEGIVCGRDLGPWNTLNSSGLLGRHAGRANVLFWDFHIESIDPKTMPADSYATETNPPWSNGPN